ncbi:hypothetical protein, unlikely [Trypanosoma brucei gambiense DAL972]|uniref:Uncharacterized protein n=1 Tax=Trypanosoma brucei gambiense (strain MHOM/CI/86/DAL972) TaxID=679716 RepID=D0A5P6_TRYB9|nr:hypothetical protein, unlikely [Trypanosoma brucei gambiense DAL972]CBH16997.1 hypothetical protein, unlikely [Trypanosoma brucei gambiense DAL972]|eukprot:XP_011779261.1 hypothetical protein, unlikely [Trypanosoma brucei gambiense DAL972]
MATSPATLQRRYFRRVTAMSRRWLAIKRLRGMPSEALNSY